MIIRRLSELPEERCVSAEGWLSRRLLLRGDNMGFSMHDTLIRTGATLHLEYKHHLEAVYCIAGKGTITPVATGEAIPIEPGTLYALDQHDKHILSAVEEMRMVCVFNPPVVGNEVHDETGAYPPGDGFLEGLEQPLPPTK